MYNSDWDFGISSGTYMDAHKGYYGADEKSQWCSCDAQMLYTPKLSILVLLVVMSMRVSWIFYSFQWTPRQHPSCSSILCGQILRWVNNAAKEGHRNLLLHMLKRTKSLSMPTKEEKKPANWRKCHWWWSFMLCPEEENIARWQCGKGRRVMRSAVIA